MPIKISPNLRQVTVIKFQKDGQLSDQEWAEYTVILRQTITILIKTIIFLIKTIISLIKMLIPKK